MYPKAQFPNPLCIIFSTTISFFIPKVLVHNFAYDNILASFASTLKELLPILECEAAIKLLHNNRMTVTLDKFQVILLHKNGSDYTDIDVKTGNKIIKSTLSVKLLGVHRSSQSKLQSSY